MSKDREQKIREILFEKKLNPNNSADWEVIMSGRAPNPDSPDGRYMAVDKSGNVYFTDSPGADRVFTDEKGRTYRPANPTTGWGGKYRPTRKYITVKTAPEEVEEEPPVVPVLVAPTPNPIPVPPSPTPKPTPKPPEDAYIDIKDPDQIITKEKLVRDPKNTNAFDVGQNIVDYLAMGSSFFPGRGRQIATVLQGLNALADVTQAKYFTSPEDDAERFNQYVQAGTRAGSLGLNFIPAGKAYTTLTRRAPAQAASTTLGRALTRTTGPLSPAGSARPKDLPFMLSNIFGKRDVGYKNALQRGYAKYMPQAREIARDPSTRGYRSALDAAFPHTLGGRTSVSARRGVSTAVPVRLGVPIFNTALLGLAPDEGPARTETETTVIPGKTRRIRIPGGGGAGNAGVSPEPAASDEGGMQLYRQGNNYFVAPDYEPSSIPEPVLQYPTGGGGEPYPSFGYPDATQGRYPADPNTWEGLPTVSAERMRMGPSRGRQYSLSMGGFGG